MRGLAVRVRGQGVGVGGRGEETGVGVRVARVDAGVLARGPLEFEKAGSLYREREGGGGLFMCVIINADRLQWLE